MWSLSVKFNGYPSIACHPSLIVRQTPYFDEVAVRVVKGKRLPLVVEELSDFDALFTQVLVHSFCIVYDESIGRLERSVRIDEVRVKVMFIFLEENSYS